MLRKYDQGKNFTNTISHPLLPLFVAGSLFALTIFIIMHFSIISNDGHLIYALDDAYIHMAIARNFAHNGVWGVTPYEFTSTSSSPLWTVLLSGIYLVWDTELAPFILNIVFAACLLVYLWHFFVSLKLQNWTIFWMLILIAFLTPLPAIIFGGMEHTMHIFLTIVLIVYFAKLLSTVEGNGKCPNYFMLPFLSLLIVATRYESLFLVCILFLLLAAKKKYFYGLMVVVAASTPVVLYGFISLSHGWFFLPNSILLKGADLSRSPLAFILRQAEHLYNNMISAPYLMILVALSLAFLFAAFLKKHSFWSVSSLVTMLFVGETFLHLSFSSIGWFFRYEGYLVASGILSLMLIIGDYFKNNFQIGFLKQPFSKKFTDIVLFMLVIILLTPLIYRATGSLLITRQATQNIYEQQYQMGRFIQRHFQNGKIAANDIGAISWLGNFHLLDLWGLASYDVALAKKNGLYNSSTINALSSDHEIEIAMVYEHWFSSYGGVPKKWIKVGEWEITNNVVCGGNVVTFYATSEHSADKLTKALKQFSRELPKTVIQRTY